MLAARACAARRNHDHVMREDLESVAPLVLQHRRPGSKHLNRELWSDKDKLDLVELLEGYE